MATIKLPPREPFLREFAASWAPLVGANPEARQKFTNQFWTNGYYDVDLPDLTVHLIALDSNLLIDSLDLASDGLRATNQIKWLTAVASHYPKVWLLYHIPPGLNGYSFLTNLPAQSSPNSWKDPLQSFFIENLQPNPQITD